MNSSLLAACVLVMILTACDPQSSAITSPGVVDSGEHWNLEPGAGLNIEITGRGFLWFFRYAGPDEILGTIDDILATGNLHVPADVTATIHLKSDDYIYSLALPHLGVHTAAIPELTIIEKFETDVAGIFELLGDQMCGYQHEDLIVKFVVEPEDQFREWVLSIQETKQP